MVDCVHRRALCTLYSLPYSQSQYIIHSSPRMYNGNSASKKCSSDWTVIALGVWTEHWTSLIECYPDVLNCCVDVRDAFHREWDESTLGDGFQPSTRERMKAKESWTAVWEACMCVLREFGLVVIVCGHGKHRSLSLGYEIAESVGCELISPRDRSHRVRLRDVHQFMSYLAPRFEDHRELFGGAKHPIVGIKKGMHEFIADEWERVCNERGEESGMKLGELHDIHEGDLVVEVDASSVYTGGWSFGSVIRGSQIIHSRWFPPSAVAEVGRYQFAGVRCLHKSLVQHWHESLSRQK